MSRQEGNKISEGSQGGSEKKNLHKMTEKKGEQNPFHGVVKSAPWEKGKVF